MLKIFCLFTLISTSICHVAFVYPPARYPPFDFLDTSRTVHPCGTPKPTNPLVTDFVVGMSYNLTWTHSNKMHKGGVRINLLDPNGNKIKQLYPENDGEYTNIHPISATVKFTEPCLNCIIQIQSQALEYGSNYIFHSCGDVNILDAVTSNDEQICSGNGAYIEEGQACSCYRGYSGSACQYRQDCETDSDCGTNGKCITEGHPSWIQKTCYCAFGYFGKNCETEFSTENSEETCFNYENLVDTNPPRFSAYGLFIPECYNEIKLNNDDVLYSRIIDSDVEIIMDFKTTGWISLGWRPDGLDPSCRIFPSLGLPKTRTFRNTYNYQSVGMTKTAFEAKLHPMDCTDIVSVSVINGRSRFQDMYTRDRSTPLIDSYFEGEFSLTAAFAVERDGRTIAMFRRNIREIEPTDHPLGPGKLFGIYAKAAGENDEFMYHGPKNKGVVMLEFNKKQYKDINESLNERTMKNKEAFIIKEEATKASKAHEQSEIESSINELNNDNLNSNDIIELTTHAIIELTQDIKSIETNLTSTKSQLNSISDSSSNELIAAVSDNTSNYISHISLLICTIVYYIFC